MVSLKLAFRRLFAKGEQTTARIVSLVAGLVFGIILIGEVFYFYSFDSFYSDSDRLYVVHENFRSDQKSEFIAHNRVSGAIAPGMKAEVPGIEAATRLNEIGEEVFYTQDRKSYKAQVSFADDNVFDVLPRKIIAGNANKALSTPMQCVVSEKIAKEIGGDVVGQVIKLKSFPDKQLIIGAVFETLPENTNYQCDVMMSMVSTPKFIWDGTQNWLGNDRYYACVKLKKGVKPEMLAKAVRKMQEKHQDIEELERKEGGEVLKYTFVPITRMYTNNKQEIILILSVLAFAVIFAAIMNYILLTVSSLVNRAKTSAIHKCYGAKASNLQQLIFSETVLLFLISISLTFVLIYAIKPFIEAQVYHKINSMINPQVIIPILALLMVMLLIVSYFPARFFARIPVASAFRSYRQKGNKWKLALLSIQFIGATFIVTVLIIVSMQYQKMLNTNHGYSVENVYYGSTRGMIRTKISTVLNKLRSMPEVEKVALGYNVPINEASGNNVMSPDGEKELFNIADFYYIDENYLSILDIKMVEGEPFTIENSDLNNVIISKKGAEKLELYNGWKDGVVGKDIEITEHNDNGNRNTIKGVFSDFTIGNMAYPDKRPVVFFFVPEQRLLKALEENKGMEYKILVKTNQNTADIVNKLTDVFNLAQPYNDAEVYSLELKQTESYTILKGFRNTMLIASSIILLISIMGLIGYTISEVNRKRKELAIRRINGATMNDLLKVFLWNIQRIAIPSIMFGVFGAWYIISMFMQYVSDKISLHWSIFAISSIAMISVIALIAIVGYRRVVGKNPVESLRYE